MMDTDAILNALGGRAEIAIALGVSRGAPNNWARVDGIPYRHWPKLRELAAEKGVAGIDDAVLAASRPVKARAA